MTRMDFDVLAANRGWVEYTELIRVTALDWNSEVDRAEAAFREIGMATCRVSGNDWRLMNEVLSQWEPSEKKFSWYFGQYDGVVAFMNEMDAVDFRLRWPR